MPDTAAFINQMRAVLTEAYDGPPHEWSYFTDNDPDAGLLPQLEALAAAEASRVIGEYSIVAHAWHLNFSMEVTLDYIRGMREPRDWHESWLVGEADEAGWREIRDDMRRHKEDLMAVLDELPDRDEIAVGAAIGALAHAAFHLGCIRQKLSCR